MNSLDNDFVPLLQDIACVMVVMNLTEVFSFDEELRYDRFIEIITEKLRKNSDVIPLTIQPTIAKTAYSIYFEKENWWIIHGCIKRDINLERKFQWKLDGTIDRIETAKALVKNKDINVIIRFVLACNYCLKTKIKTIWKHMNPEQKFYVFRDYGDGLFIRIWTIWLNSENLLEWSSLVKKCVEKYLLEKDFLNLVWLRYYFNELPQNLSFRCLKILIGSEIVDCNDLRFYIFHLEEYKQKRLLEDHPVIMLKYFMEKPLQGKYVEALDHLRTDLSAKDYRFLLAELRNKSKKDSTYAMLFKETLDRSVKI
ncbi:hypothetical protein NPIL_200561 [Nephila pilipes]|uniref:Uncharacterized protein n=1 Tax=Nephila pilipes TaxID=299642 RepID=A0A8X6PLQ6_NEPPI|nr:hypothetical protein NPIL_200561 [Nephila pilipes]